MIDYSSVQGYVNSCRDYIAKLDDVSRALEVLRLGGENALGFDMSSRVNYCLYLAAHLAEMASEALYHAANLAPKAMRHADGDVVRELRFGDNGEVISDEVH